MIKDAEFECKKITVFIGPQASGKSIAAKCHYFFWVYISDIFRECLLESYTRPKFNKRKIEQFLLMFPSEGAIVDEFSVKWECEGFEIEIFKENGKSIKIKISSDLAKLVDQYRREFKRFLEKSHEENDDFIGDEMYKFRTSSKNIDLFNRALPRALFVPASRAFFSTIQDEVFTLLSAQQSLGDILIRFGRFYKAVRQKYDFRRRRISRNQKTTETTHSVFRKVLGGEYRRSFTKDYINTSWGDVDLINSSSGQQEALPLILSIIEYPIASLENQLLIIEEPEAHLYPNAQKEILELIVEASYQKRCKVFFTTHSPYIISCLNNEILKRGWNEKHISAYYVNSGSIKNIFDNEDNLVGLEELDNVSNKLAKEYFNALK